MSASEEKTICIVGVAGFIGSHLLEKIIRERSWTVIGVDMVAPTKIQQLLGAEKKWASRFEFHQMDIVKAGPDLEALVARADVVVNLAAICNPSEYIKQPVNTINSNFTDAQDCINFCVKHDKHLIHFSTCEVYGRTLASYGLPADDPKNYILDEETTPMIMGPVSAQVSLARAPRPRLARAPRPRAKGGCRDVGLCSCSRPRASPACEGGVPRRRPLLVLTHFPHGRGPTCALRDVALCLAALVLRVRQAAG